jgi:hypothetical protein
LVTMRRAKRMSWRRAAMGDDYSGRLGKKEWGWDERVWRREERQRLVVSDQ